VVCVSISLHACPAHLANKVLLFSLKKLGHNQVNACKSITSLTRVAWVEPAPRRYSPLSS
jgi:hypothetical protein